MSRISGVYARRGEDPLDQLGVRGELAQVVRPIAPPSSAASARRSARRCGRLEADRGRQASVRRSDVRTRDASPSTSTSVSTSPSALHPDRSAAGPPGRHDRRASRRCRPRLEQREPAVGGDDVEVVAREHSQPADRVACDDRHEPRAERAPSATSSRGRGPARVDRAAGCGIRRRVRSQEGALEDHRDARRVLRVGGSRRPARTRGGATTTARAPAAAASSAASTHPPSPGTTTIAPRGRSTSAGAAAAARRGPRDSAPAATPCDIGHRAPAISSDAASASASA